MNDLFARFRVLPLLVLVAMFAFAVRVGEAVTDVRDITASALAEETPAAGDDTEKGAAAQAAGEKAAEGQTGAALETSAAAEGEAAKPAEAKAASRDDATLPEVWGDPAQQDMADSPEQLKLLEDLAERRAQLEAREKALETREALMKASEKQIDGKISEMTALKDQMEKLLGQQEEQQNGKIKSLVKIYEGMKPKEAAAIFNQMDMNILLQVVTHMSERKSAPVIASMDTAKANELTARMSEMSKLPETSDAAGGFMGANTAATPASTGPTPTAAPAGSAALPGLDALGRP